MNSSKRSLINEEPEYQPIFQLSYEFKDNEMTYRPSLLLIVNNLITREAINTIFKQINQINGQLNEFCLKERQH